MEMESAHSIEFVLMKSEDVGFDEFVIDKFVVHAMLSLECEKGVIVDSVTYRLDVKTRQRSIHVEFDPTLTGPRRLLNKLLTDGYQFQVASSGASSCGDSVSELKRQWSRRFWVSLVFCVPVIFIAFIFPAIGGSVEAGMEAELAEGLNVSTFLLFHLLFSW